ncbi:MAG: lipoyl(octanoyl) transferase LipB [Planctomycetes bacterium]|jgi:lipoyl(octanoyl) transferase|nr:lipoyl(octanoyl) transferase LipB [Phycisphaerae bacterium]NBB94608.1 lipoyl(octanoyl) transferase LipB [Planctomycetota bacterium]
MSVLNVKHLGPAAYGPVLARQTELVGRVLERPEEAYLLLVEHDPPVITLGRRGGEADVLASRERLAELGVEVHESSRGGEVTYHGPGQLVGYPILHLDRHGRTVRGHVKNIEQVLIDTLDEFGIPAHRKDPAEELTGVWTGSQPHSGEAKIAAIGVAVRRWVSYHGWALNVNTDLSHFDLIVPCGIRDKGVTSMARQLGGEQDIAAVADTLVRRFAAMYRFESVADE